MKKIIVILAVVAVSALIIVCGVDKVVDWVKEAVERSFFTAKLGELQKKGNVYIVKKTQEPYSGKFIDTYGNGNTKEAGTLKNGKRDGEIKAYYENGNLMRAEYYIEGKPDGEWKNYYENYDENGKLMRIENYKDGEPDGKWEHYDENVKPMRVENYKNGKLDEKLVHYDEWKQMLSSFTDPVDGKAYATVEIGLQTWMAENLNSNASGSKCYNNDESNCQKYGRLYDWNTALKSCPSGWHLPSREEWELMTAYIGGGGGDAKGKKLKARSGWNDKSDGSSGNGTDEFGFSALPGGYVDPDSKFGDVGNYGRWWGASEYSNNAFSYDTYYNIESTGWKYRDKSSLFSVRCVKD